MIKSHYNPKCVLDFRFSRRRVWRCLSSRMLRRVVSYKLTDVSEVLLPPSSGRRINSLLRNQSSSNKHVYKILLSRYDAINTHFLYWPLVSCQLSVCLSLCYSWFRISVMSSVLFSSGACFVLPHFSYVWIPILLHKDDEGACRLYPAFL
jgi:hypothetical protein